MYQHKNQQDTYVIVNTNNNNKKGVILEATSYLPNNLLSVFYEKKICMESRQITPLVKQYCKKNLDLCMLYPNGAVWG